jgi:hypothetical protein
VTPPPLHGTKTHPLTSHALDALDALRTRECPTQVFNPGVVNRLQREALVEIVDLPSPYRSHKGRKIPHLRITDAGLSRWEAETRK